MSLSDRLGYARPPANIYYRNTHVGRPGNDDLQRVLVRTGESSDLERERTQEAARTERRRGSLHGARERLTEEGTPICIGYPWGLQAMISVSHTPWSS